MSEKIKKLTQITFKGKMELQEQEGGYCAPDLVIDGRSVTSEIDQLFAEGESLFIAALPPPWIRSATIEGEWELTLRKVEK